MKKILILAEPKYDGCTWYRLRQFAFKANELGLADVQFMDLKLDAEVLTQVIEKSDVLVSRLNPNLPIMQNFLRERGINKPLVIDIDDAMEYVDPYSDIYKNLGIKEIKLDNEYLWKDGRDGFDIERNKRLVEMNKKSLSSANCVFVTTIELEKYAKQFNDTVAIIPNAINFNIFPQLDLNKKEIRLMYAGGSTHFSDLMSIKPQLDKLMKKNKNLHFYLLGVPFGAITKDMPKDRVHTMGWVQADGHGYRLACMGADIAIAPLTDTPFNRMKSSVKYYEYSALRVSTVAKNIPPYSDDINNGVSGILYNTPEDFYSSVQDLINSKEKRDLLGENAFKYVKKFRNLDDITHDWVEVLNSL